MKQKYISKFRRLAVASLSSVFLLLPNLSAAEAPVLPQLPDAKQEKAKVEAAVNKILDDVNNRIQNQIRVCDRDISYTGLASCDAHVVADASGYAKNFIQPSGLSPQQLRAAYNLAGISGTHRTVAIVDAYDHQNIKSDLDFYSNQFGLPVLPNCIGNIASSTVPCFKKVDQRGGTRFPRRDSGWALEIALDVEAVHAVCPDCSILLVESDSNSYNNLFAGIDRAAILGATAISNSWGGSEFFGETSYDYRLNKPGVAITASSGDSGYGVSYPAASPYITAVGGTTLNMNGLAYVNETAWNGAGSGCSAYEPKPAWQTDPGCAKRTVADVSAVADPNTGAAIYDSVRYGTRSGWFQVGGTSLSSPIIAAIYAMSGNTSNSSLPYSLGNLNNLRDILSGSNGSCLGSYLCSSGAGYDGPTGLGTPNGTSAF